MRRIVISILIVIIFAACSLAQTKPAEQVRAQIRKEIEHTAADPSQRSIVATPSIDFSAELAKDKKTATVKAGIALGEAFTLEGGFTGAFSEADDRSTITSVRGLATGSKGWGGLTYKRYRLKPNLGALQKICWEYLWSTGQGLFDKDAGCQESHLPTESYAERLASASPRSGVRAICQRFLRAASSAPTDHPAIDCDVADVKTITDAISMLREHGAVGYRALGARTDANILELCNEYRRSVGKPPTDEICKTEELPEKSSWREQVEAAVANKLELCNEYRRSIGKPPTAEICKTGELPEKSWREQVEAAVQSSSTDQVRVDICNEYLAAKGLPPGKIADCTSIAGADPLFNESFHDRYAAAYHWGITPIATGRYEVNRSKFSYLDNTFTQQDPKHNSGAFLADLGFLTPGGTLVTVGYRYSDVWTATPSVTVCRPITGTDATKCVPAILDGPVEKKTHAIEAQAKQFVTKNIAAQIVAAMDQDNHWQVDLPIYFIPDKDSKGLTGGIVASYQSEQRRWDISVFVGQRFSLFQ